MRERGPHTHTHTQVRWGTMSEA